MIISSINSPRSFETSEATPPFCIFCIEGVVFNKELPFPSFFFTEIFRGVSNISLFLCLFRPLISLSSLRPGLCKSRPSSLYVRTYLISLFLSLSAISHIFSTGIHSFIHSHKSRRCFFCKFWKISDTVRPKQALSNGSYSENWSNRSPPIIEQRISSQ